MSGTNEDTKNKADRAVQVAGEAESTIPGDSSEQLGQAGQAVPDLEAIKAKYTDADGEWRIIKARQQVRELVDCCRRLQAERDRVQELLHDVRQSRDEADDSALFFIKRGDKWRERGLKAEAERDSAERNLAAAREEIRQLRETNSRLNRRAQKAESRINRWGASRKYTFMLWWEYIGSNALKRAAIREIRNRGRIAELEEGKAILLAVCAEETNRAERAEAELAARKEQEMVRLGLRVSSAVLTQPVGMNVHGDLTGGG